MYVLFRFKTCAKNKCQNSTMENITKEISYAVLLIEIIKYTFVIRFSKNMSSKVLLTSFFSNYMIAGLHRQSIFVCGNFEDYKYLCYVINGLFLDF